MSCSSCDALRAKGKTCWRHAAVEPSVGCCGPLTPAQIDALFDTYHPNHRGHQKSLVRKSFITAGYDFLCSCGVTLHLTLLAVHFAATPPPPSSP